MTKRTTLMDEIHDDLGRRPELRVRFERELARLKLANRVIALREELGISQAELARRIGTQQSAVARMERSDYTAHTVSTLVKIAAAAGRHLEVRFVADGRRPKSS